MIAYSAQKKQFLADGPRIADVVRDSVKSGLGIGVTHSEYQAWQNSLGNAMFHTLNTSDISDDVGIAVEYRINGRGNRIDMILTGEDASGTQSAVIVELKQWSKVEYSQLDDHVKTVVGGGLRDLQHPSYQARSYAQHLEDLCAVVTEDPINLRPCAFLHNLEDEQVIRDSRFSGLIGDAPVFLKPEMHDLRAFIAGSLPTGDRRGSVERLDSSPIRPSKSLADALASMLEGHEEFVLLDEQKEARERIRFAVKEKRANRKVILINGGPGTGKSVVAINALSTLASEGFNARYVSKNAAPRTVFQEKLKQSPTKKVRTNVSSLFSGSGAFVGAESQSFDCLLVDEAHRLGLKSGLYGNLGENQIKEIIAASSTAVFFIDESQMVTWQDVGNIEEIEKWAAWFKADVERVDLGTQFRCQGSNEFVNWVDNLLDIRKSEDTNFLGGSFECDVVDSIEDLRSSVLERNLARNTARMVAGYCWDWVSKKDSSKYDFVFPNSDVRLQWNLEKYGSKWIIDPASVDEVGCIHTAQGLEVEHVGVIIGPDLQFRDGKLRTYPEERAHTDASLKGYGVAKKQDPREAAHRADRLIRNTYRTLLTRGQLSCTLFSTDPETNQYLKDMLRQSASAKETSS